MRSIMINEGRSEGEIFFRNSSREMTEICLKQAFEATVANVMSNTHREQTKIKYFCDELPVDSFAINFTKAFPENIGAHSVNFRGSKDSVFRASYIRKSVP